MNSEIKKIKAILNNDFAENCSITVAGWVRSKRESKNIAFLVISDGSSQETIQIVIEPSSPSFTALANAQTGAAVVVNGTLKKSTGKGQSWEILASQIDVTGLADAETYPLQKKGHTLEFLREIEHLRPRTNTFGAVFRVRNALAQGVHTFFQNRGFMWVHTPIVTASDCEGAGEMFHVTTLDLKNTPRNPDKSIDFSKDFFGKEAHLTVSGQLEAEFMAMSLGNVYTFGPTFRAENSNTTRHLAEFWMIEPEMAFANLDDDIALAQDFFKFLCGYVVEKCPQELEFLESMYKVIKVSEIQALATSSFARVTYAEAVDILLKSKQTFEFPVAWGQDLQSEHERFLTDQVFKSPAVVTDYPKDIKAFYMRVNEDQKTVAAMDVLAPRIGEIIGGSQREERLDLLQKRIHEMKIPQANIEWYLDLRRFGTCQHAGFGMGFERLVQYITGMGNIRDVVISARAPGRI